MLFLTQNEFTPSTSLQIFTLVVPPQKLEKIDLDADHACPCRHRGRLVAITLTDAFGCDRCQQIFVVEGNGYVLEQLCTNYPYKRTWSWTGRKWNPMQPKLGKNQFPMVLAMILLFAIIGLPLAFRFTNGSGMIIWATIVVLLATLPAIIAWFNYRP